MMRTRTWMICSSLVLSIACQSELPTSDPSADAVSEAPPPLTPSTFEAVDESAPKPANVPEFLPGAFEILAVEPVEGLITGGEEVVVTGTGFEPGMVVLFDQSPGVDFFLLHEGMAIMRAPPHPAGRVDVSIYHPDIDFGSPRTLEGAYLYYADVVVAEVNPPMGHVDGGEPITVVGTGFDPSSRFFIGGKLALDQAIGTDAITGLTPPGTLGSADVHVVNASGTALLKDGYTYGKAPTIAGVSPMTGPPAGGTLVRLSGDGFSADLTVQIDDTDLEIEGLDPAGAWVEIVIPPGAPGATASIAIANAWGADLAEHAWVWTDADADPYLLDCPVFYPASGPAAGGTSITMICTGLQYGATVTLGGIAADAVSVDADTQTLIFTTPPLAPGDHPVVVTSPHATIDVGTYTAESAPPVSLASISPSSGPVGGGVSVTLNGAGFEAQLTVFIGGLPATDVEVLSASEIRATTPIGSPGLVDVRVLQEGHVARLKDGYEYEGEGLTLALVTPSFAAMSGGTYLRVFGTGFEADASVTVGGVEAPIIQVISGSEIHVRSPRLEVDTYPATVTSGGSSATLENAITIYNPRSGYSGTWGAKIDETLNVTVRGTNKYGPVAGAFVLVQHFGGAPFTGYTDDQGQITFSEPGFTGPVTVTASHPEFDAYSIVSFDATNVTLFLRPKKPGTPKPPPEWPDAILSGQVIGLGKYVLPPPGTCEGLVIPETEHCKPCNPDAGCDGDAFACVTIGPLKDVCLASCLGPADCPAGYVCGPAMGGTRCMPAPGQKIAQCFVSSSSPFGLMPQIQEGGWVLPGESYEILSGRLGEIAVICFGGYLGVGDVFVPTIMGVRRHLFAEPAAVMTDLDVTLNLPLKKTLRLRLMDPPTWPSGVKPPAITLSLDLGPDGAIPMTRDLLSAGDNIWLAPRQLQKLSGAVYDAKYFFYTRLYADTGTNTPASFSLITGIDEAAETRLPVRTDGAWSLESGPLEEDLYDLWGPNSQQIYAVGDAGKILLYNGNAWSEQSSGTEHDLRAISGRSGADVYAVGEKGTTLHWDGMSWKTLAPPEEDLRDVLTAPGFPVYVAGAVRVHRLDNDTWVADGPAWVQGTQALARYGEEGVVAVGELGALYVRDANGDWTSEQLPTQQTLRAALTYDGAVYAVGDGGTIIRWTPEDGASLEMSTTDRDLTGIAPASDGGPLAIGDDGVALRRVDGAWVREEIPDDRSKGYGIFTPPDGGPTRVVGSSAFIIGPILHFPIITAPLHDGNLSSPKLEWTTDGGPASQVTRLAIYSNVGKLLWTFVVDGEKDHVLVPDMVDIAGFSPLGSGSKRLDVTRILNPDFDIDNYTSREFSF